MDAVLVGRSKTQAAPGELDRLLPGLSRVWEESQGDPEIRIAILDGPVDLSHPWYHGANRPQDRRADRRQDFRGQTHFQSFPRGNQVQSPSCYF
jgi:hypothetical protein